jgi:hypothetical protein
MVCLRLGCGIKHAAKDRCLMSNLNQDTMIVFSIHELFLSVPNVVFMLACDGD